MSASTLYVKCKYCPQVVNEVSLKAHVTRKHPIVKLLQLEAV